MHPDAQSVPIVPTTPTFQLGEAVASVCSRVVLAQDVACGDCGVSSSPCSSSPQRVLTTNVQRASVVVRQTHLKSILRKAGLRETACSDTACCDDAKKVTLSVPNRIVRRHEAECVALKAQGSEVGV